MANYNYTITEELERLTEHSIQCYRGIMVSYFDRHCSLDFDWDLYDGCWCSNGDAIAYVINNCLFVTPWTDEAYETVSTALKKDDFCVPFSTGDYPYYEEGMWKQLKARAERINHCKLVAEAKEHCAENGVSDLSEYTLSVCFRMPIMGIEVESDEDKIYKKIYPVMSLGGGFHSEERKKFLGTYCCNKDIVAFVTSDGTEFVAKGYKILNELREAGFHEAEFTVPFSNGEKPKEPYLLSMWEKVPNPT